MKGKTAILTLSIATAALAVQSSPKLAWTPKVGSTLEYAVVANSKDDSGLEITFKADQIQKVKSVENKKIKVESTMKNIRVLVNGQDMGDMAGGAEPESQTSTHSEDGEMLESTAAGDANGHRIAQFMILIYPNKETGVGTSWTRKYKGTAEIPSSETKYTYAGLEAVKTISCHKVTFSFKETSGDKPTTVNGTAWLRASDGELVKWDGKLENVVWQAGLAPAVATMTVELKK